MSFPAHLGYSSLSLTTSELAICALLCSQQALTSMNSAEKSQAHCQRPSLEAGNCSNIINHKFPACAPYLGLLSSPPPPIPGFLKGSNHLSRDSPTLCLPPGKHKADPRFLLIITEALPQSNESFGTGIPKSTLRTAFIKEEEKKNPKVGDGMQNHQWKETLEHWKKVKFHSGGGEKGEEEMEAEKTEYLEISKHAGGLLFPCKRQWLLRPARPGFLLTHQCRLLRTLASSLLRKTGALIGHRQKRDFFMAPIYVQFPRISNSAKLFEYNF